MQLLQLNKFGHLHNNTNLIFCRTECLPAEFKKIKKRKQQVVLISGNSDRGVDEALTAQMPENIDAWYCQNKLVRDDRLIGIPIGLENTFINKRKKHGVGWPHAIEKVKVLQSLINHPDNRQPVKLLYANFNVATNKPHRELIKNVAKNCNFIDWKEPSLNYTDFVNDVLDHEAVICPAGNGVDTHRLYEVLYCRRVAVTIKTGDYAIYEELYRHLPIVVLNKLKELHDHDHMKELIGLARQKNFNHDLLDFNYWQRLITNHHNTNVKAGKNVFKRISGLFKTAGQLKTII